MLSRFASGAVCRLARRSYHGGASPLRVSREVRSALDAGKPVVALESTIITHGMPYPHNRDTALQVEDIVRAEGAVPATVAIFQNKLHVGLEAEELEMLSQAKNSLKVSRRDMAVALSQGHTGGTTVSGTMVAAHMAGIHVFVTGGIGGVHRGAGQTFDVSADLTELGRTPVAVICAGVKSILDIPATLEYLETQGVAVMTYAGEGEGPKGEEPDFPAFFTRESGHRAPHTVRSPTQAANIIASSLELGLESGLVIGVPVPVEHAADRSLIEDAIHAALTEAGERGIEGKAITPYLLQRVNELTRGASLQANIALVKNNAMVGSQIACALAKTRQSSTHAPKQSTTAPVSGSAALGMTASPKASSTSAPRSSTHAPTDTGRVVVVGGVNIDFTSTFATDHIEANGQTYRGRVRQSVGGVGRNLADGLTGLGCGPFFVSAVGEDAHAHLFHARAREVGMDTRGVREIGASATYTAVLNHTGDLLYGIGDFDAHNNITPEHVCKYEAYLKDAPVIVIDGNIPVDTIAYVTDVAKHHGVPVWFEPTDIGNVHKVFEAGAMVEGGTGAALTYTSPNLNELRTMYNLCHGSTEVPTQGSNAEGALDEVMEEVQMLASAVLPFVKNIIVTLGRHGAVLTQRKQTDHFEVKGRTWESKDSGPEGYYFEHYAVPSRPGDIVSVSGAGDCMNCAILWQILQGSLPARCLEMGIAAAQLSLGHHEAVPRDFSTAAVTKQWARMYPAAPALTKQA